jgi:hypothetical protein
LEKEAEAVDLLGTLAVNLFHVFPHPRWQVLPFQDETGQGADGAEGSLDLVDESSQ